MSDGVRAARPFKKAPGDARNWAFIFEDAIDLPANTTISSVQGTPTVTSADEAPVTLALANVAVATASFIDDDGETVPASKAVKADVTGGIKDANYLISIIVNLNTGEKIEGVWMVYVRQ